MSDTSEPDSNDEWRGRSPSTSIVRERKFLGVVRHKHAEEEYTKAVEDEDSVECELNGTRDCFAGILGFSNGYTYEFGSYKLVLDGAPTKAMKVTYRDKRRLH